MIRLLASRSLVAGKVLALALIAALCGSGCENPLEPCNGMAEIKFENQSRHSSYDVIVDGSRIGTIGKGDDMTHEVAPGTHTVQFVYSNTARSACSQSQPNVAKCETITLSCNYDVGE